MEEVVDMETNDATQDLELVLDEKPSSIQLPKRSRFVPLQKFTLHKLQVIYEETKKLLEK